MKGAYQGELLELGSAEQLANAAAELFVNLAAEATNAPGRFRVALSGGTTPRRVYELLATDSFRDRVDWKGVELFWGDERYVPPEDRDSNYRMTREALLRHVPMPAENIHRVPTEISPPDAAAAAYENEIRQRFGDSIGVPRFDLVLLGLGTNGHTASLFPQSPTLHETKKLVVADFVSEVNVWRLTMTVPLLNRGRTVAFLVSGQEKAQVLRDVLRGPRNTERLPAQLIAPEGKLLWLVDNAAASLLTSADD
jgi:6-phosphogluconolactonase